MTAKLNSLTCLLWCIVTFCLGMIKQFLRDVDWGEVDYLIVDTPPGTSDEHLSIVQYLSGAGIDGAVIITTPQVNNNTRTCQTLRVFQEAAITCRDLVCIIKIKY